MGAAYEKNQKNILETLLTKTVYAPGKRSIKTSYFENGAKKKEVFYHARLKDGEFYLEASNKIQVYQQGELIQERTYYPTGELQESTQVGP